MPVALAACSRTKAAMMSPIPKRPIGGASTGVVGGVTPAAAAARVSARRWLIMMAVVAMLRMATAAMATRMARLPNQPMMKVARGGPATQATETTARVLTMSTGRAPAWRSCANSMELPTPAGPPITIRAIAAIGKVVTTAKTTASRTVRAPQTNMGPR